VTLFLATGWTLIGGAMAAAIYWSFLITPVSTVMALVASAALALVWLALVGLTASGAIEIWSRGLSFDGIKHAGRSAPAVLPASVIVLLAWWTTSRMEVWLAQRNGQISAWFIATVGWADVSWLFAAIGYVAVWVRWVLAAMLGVSLMAGVRTIGWSAIAQAAWLRRALHPRALAGATLWFAALIALPWTWLVPWRPDNLPASSVELAFIVAKLSLAAVLCAAGLALIVREAAVPSPPPVEPTEAAQAA
jgi:hypothetical protein